MKDILSIAIMRMDFLKNIFRFREKGAIFKFVVISGFVITFWISSLLLFLKGFSFLESFPGIGDLIGDRMLYIAFGIIFFMLIISTAIVSYSTHYRSNELPLLFSRPIRHSSIFVYKSVQAIFLSSWASIFLISPLLIAYGITKTLGASFYLISILFFLPICVISGMIGIVITMFIVGRIQGKVLRYLWTFSIIILLTITFLAFHLRRGEVETDNVLLLTVNQLLSHTRIFLFPLLPSFWVSEGVICLAKSKVSEALFYLLLLLTTACVCVIIGEALAKRFYLNSWLFSQGAYKKRKNILAEKVELLSPMLRFIPGNVSSFVIKDLKTFLRDPQQWSQALIFLGLLGAYILNLRKMPYDIEAIFWKKMILFLDITSTIIILAMLSQRFAFPLVSFEGKRFWITTLSPINLRGIILEKFWVTAIGLSIMGETLIILLNIMLKANFPIFLISSGIVVVASFSFAGLSIGIGSLFPNFREDNFAKISSGFGGVLLLILTLAYICLIVVFGAVPVFVVKETSRFFFASSIIAGVAIVLVSLVSSTVPLLLGIRALERRDF